MKIAIGGSHQMACNALSYLIELGIDKKDIVVCKSNRDSEVNTWQRSLIFCAKKLEVDIVSLDKLYEVEDLLFFSLEFDQIIRTKKFKSAKFFNIHFSLLPKYKGMYTSCLPLLNGEHESGVTLHRIDDGIDTGEIVDQISFPLPLTMNSFELFNTYHLQGFDLFKRNIQQILIGQESSCPQSVLNSSYYPKGFVDFSQINVDFKKTAFQIHNFIRAFSFRPYQLATIEDFKISHSKITSKRSISKPGEITGNDPECCTYSTIDFDIELYPDRLDEILNASAENNLNFIQKCGKNGYNFLEKNENGWDAGIVAAYNGAYDVLDYLLKQGYDPNSVNVNGTSVLMYAMTKASETGELKSMIRLISSGADLHHCDFNHISLKEYGNKQNNSTVVEFLERVNQPVKNTH
ncbi:formyltransferase family protein [Algoriphagus sp.]|uniref:formyltransferase family protein n=1 Tax=Algoriphagus sp. TaxID=1872435 RepID=UPI00391DF0ED